VRRLIVAGLLVVAACTQVADGSGRLDVTLRDFEIELGADTVTAGVVSFTVVNEGEDHHTLVVESIDHGAVLAAVPALAPGESATLTVELAPGRYFLTCRVVETEEGGVLEDHLEMGMVTVLTVEA